jgi:hypothetical protein
LPDATLLVVSYDPVRRKGFMKIIDPPIKWRQVHFVLSYLPEAFKAPIVVMSRPFNLHWELSADDFKQHMWEVKRAVVGARFRATLVADALGRPIMVRKTITHLPTPGEPEPGGAADGS